MKRLESDVKNEIRPFVIAASSSSFAPIGTVSVQKIAYLCTKEIECGFKLEFENTNFGPFNSYLHTIVNELNQENKIEIINGKIEVNWTEVDKEEINLKIEESKEKLKKIEAKYGNMYEITREISRNDK